MILSEIWAECGRLLNDPNNQRWTTDVLTIRANLAQTEIQGFTNAVKTPETVTPTQGIYAITINANTMNIIRATKTLTNGSLKPFDGKTIEELDFLYPDWRQWQPGEPLFYYYDATQQTINIIPATDSANTISNGITIWESRKPAALSNSYDIPFDSIAQMIPYHPAICHWVTAQCWMDDGTPESLGKAKFHKSGSMLHPGEYEKQLGRIMAEFDSPDNIQSNILWKPEGGRAGGWGFPSKSMPLTF